MPKYVINTKEEFNSYLEQFKVARGCYNFSAFLDLFSELMTDEYNSLKSFNGLYLIGTKDLNIFLKKMVAKNKLNPTSLVCFSIGSNRLYRYSLYKEIDDIITALDKSKDQDKMVENGIPIRNVIVPRELLVHKPDDETKTLIKKYIYLWELYVVLNANKFNIRLSYDVFKNRMIKNITNLDDFIPLQQLARTKALMGVLVDNEDKFIIAKDNYVYHELISVPYIMNKYTCKTDGNKLKIGTKRQYKKGRS